MTVIIPGVMIDSGTSDLECPICKHPASKHRRFSEEYEGACMVTQTKKQWYTEGLLHQINPLAKKKFYEYELGCHCSLGPMDIEREFNKTVEQKNQ